jgi:glycogen operon protein
MPGTCTGKCDGWGDTSTLGAHWTADKTAVVFRVGSTRATRLELDLFAQPTGAAATYTVVMTQDPGGSTWSATVDAAHLPSTIYYGYRVWGPNWTYDPSWQPGSATGWITDVDSAGNRMNPNKLVWDPYAVELSHDPLTPSQLDGTPYATGSHRTVDSAPVAPKGIVLALDPPDYGTKPTQPLRDDVVYEVHLRGFTELDPAAGGCAGTYAGAATRASYLATLGVTAIELLPIAEFQNDTNDVDPTSDSGDDYFGYNTLAYFAPDRRYACDMTPGGPTREVRAMVRAFHDAGIKVFLDVVYNHTAEQSGSSLYSERGLDNAGYYQLNSAGTGFTNNNSVGADLATTKPLAKGLVLDSLHYWRDAIGVDGFRFDLAPVLGNVGGTGAFSFDPTGFPTVIATELGRPVEGGDGADLIAEPWAGPSSAYSVGKFPVGWAEWNDKIRDTIRQTQNAQESSTAQPTITLGSLANRLAGSPDVYNRNGRSPQGGVSYIVSHDGFTLHDQFACDSANNNQPWPYGPNDGGNPPYSWDQAMDGGTPDPAAQRQAVRTALALELLSAGVPMITGGDELGRSTHCNSNPYTLDSVGNWLDWTTQGNGLWNFTQWMLHFRTAHPELRPPDFSSPPTWLDATGQPASSTYLADVSQPVLAWTIGNAYVGYNRGITKQTLTLPSPGDGLTWYRVANTAAFMEPQGNFSPADASSKHASLSYDLDARAIVILVAQP